MADIFEKLKEKFVDAYDDDDEELENVSDYEQVNNADVRKMNAKMIVNEPRSYEEAQDIARCLIDKKACVVNIHRLQESNATRLLDFLSGVTFSIGGSIQKIDTNVFLFAPKELPIHGSVESDN